MPPSGNGNRGNGNPFKRNSSNDPNGNQKGNNSGGPQPFWKSPWLWGVLLVRLLLALTAAVLGNMVPVPFILLLIRRIFDWLRGTRLFGPRIDWLERRAHLKGRMVRKYRLPGLIILVAIPLPGTGAWTGALVAALLDIRMRHALPAIFLGVVIAGAIVTTLTYGVVQLF